MRVAVSAMLGGLLVAALLRPLGAAELSTHPLLRVETGAHNGAITAIATDASNRYLVSGGLDKTIRLWSRSSGELLKVIRPPIGEGPRGVVSSLALSPDGSTIAAGGFFCTWYQDSFCALLFETASGRMMRSIGGLPNGVISIAWSPDGAMLALGLNQRGGLRLIRTRDWTQIGADAGYGALIDDIHFGARARIATASRDGTVRVYAYTQDTLKLLVKKTTAELVRGRVGQPRAVRFSPDGSKLAVGQSVTSATVSVHNPDDLGLLYTASTNWGLGIGTSRLAWSANGEYLYAGVASVEKKPMFLRRWSSGGRGFATDLPAGTGSILSLLEMKDGSVAFATASALMGLYDATGKLAWERVAQSGQFYGTTESFKVSEDGTRVELSYDGTSQGVVNFDTRARRLATGPAKDVAMREPVTAGGSLNFFNQWRDTRGTLQAGGRRLEMGPAETSRSLSIAPDFQSFAVGTSSQLRYYAANGRQSWAVSAPEAFAVNHSGNGMFVIAAFGDGTVRWFGRKSGRLLATLYIAPDRKRWVLATPPGYYDSSVGAEDFLGWHFNRGRDEAADFFPVSRFRSRFYRPELVARILQQGDDSEAVRLAASELATVAKPPQKPAPAQPAASKPAVAPAAPAQVPGIAETDDTAVESTVAQTVADIDKVLPPVVTILSPGPGVAITSNPVVVRYSVRSAADAPVLDVRTRVNGLSQAARSLVVNRAEDVREITVNVPPEDSEIMLFAENRHGVSAPATVKVAWRGKAPVPAAERKPVLYVLAIGVSAYDKPEYRLNYAAKDAGDFVAIVQKQKGRLYGDVVVRLLTDHQASSKEVIEAFNWLQKQITENDVGMIFIAGHGINDERGRYYFLPANADVDRLQATGVPFNEIRTRLGNLNGKALLFVDTCHSGNVMGGRTGLSNDINGVLNELSSPEYGLVVLASSTGKQFSLEDASWGNGAFTKALVEGLAGQADLKKRGRITHKMLDFYVSDRVDELTHGQQTPVNPSPQGVPDYPIAFVGT